MTAARVLIASGEDAIGRFLHRVLSEEGLRVQLSDGMFEQEVTDDPPDLLVMADHDGTGLDALRRLRSGAVTSAVPIVVLAGRGRPVHLAAALEAGADDVLALPFDTLELVARVRSALRRSADVRAASPLTGMPGNHRIDREIAARAAGGEPYAVCHVDLDDFKSFNDCYGFLRGDGVLLLVAAVLQREAVRAGAPPVFVGHIGGDDFIIVAMPEQADPLCEAVLKEFDTAVPGLYDPVDADRGGLTVADRRGETRWHPLVAVSIGIATGQPGRDHWAVVAAAGEMKVVAKSDAGSCVAVDRRGCE